MHIIMVVANIVGFRSFLVSLNTNHSSIEEFSSKSSY